MTCLDEYCSLFWTWYINYYFSWTSNLFFFLRLTNDNEGSVKDELYSYQVIFRSSFTTSFCSIYSWSDSTFPNVLPDNPDYQLKLDYFRIMTSRHLKTKVYGILCINIMLDIEVYLIYTLFWELAVLPIGNWLSLYWQVFILRLLAMVGIESGTFQLLS